MLVEIYTQDFIKCESSRPELVTTTHRIQVSSYKQAVFIQAFLQRLITVKNQGDKEDEG